MEVVQLRILFARKNLHLNFKLMPIFTEPCCLKTEKYLKYLTTAEKENL